MRARRRRARAFFALLFLVMAAAAARGASYVSYLPRFSITEIDVAGAREMPPELVRDFAETILYDGSRHFLSRANVLFYPRAAIERGIVANFPRIASAAIAHASPLSNSITIQIVERRPYALWCLPAQPGGQDANPQTCYSMDSGGFIFAEAPAASASSTSQYVFAGGIATSSRPIGQTFAPSHLPGLVSLLQLLGQSGFDPAGAVVESDQDFSIPLASGFSVKTSFGEDPGALARNLQLVLSSAPLQGRENDLEYVDLRFGDRVYYKLKGEPQVTSTPNAGGSGGAGQ